MHTNTLYPVSPTRGLLLLFHSPCPSEEPSGLSTKCFRPKDARIVSSAFSKDHRGGCSRLHCWVSFACAWLGLWLHTGSYLRSSQRSAAGSLQDTVCLIKARGTQLRAASYSTTELQSVYFSSDITAHTPQLLNESPWKVQNATGCRCLLSPTHNFLTYDP